MSGTKGAARFLLGRFFRPYWRLLVVLTLLNAGVGVLQGLQPVALAPAVNAVLQTEQPPAERLRDIDLNNVGPTLLRMLGMEDGGALQVVVVMAVVYVALALFIALLGATAFTTAAWMRSCVLKDMITSLHHHVIRLPLGYFVRRSTGDIVSRFVNDTASTAAALDAVIRGMLQSAIQMTICLALLVRTDPVLSLSTLGVGSMHFLITRSLSGWVRRRTAAVYDFIARMTAVVQETCQNIRIIKSFAAEPFDGRRVDEATEQVKRSLFRFRLSRYAEEPVRLVADALAIAVMLLLAHRAMVEGRLNVTGFAMFIFLARQVVAPLSELAKNVLGLQGAMGGAQRIIEMFRTVSDMPDGDGAPPTLARGLSLRGVSFAYLPDRPVLRGIDVDIPRGSLVAIVGPSGSGKSTLIDLVLRLYDPDAGVVQYDGVDVRSFRQDDYRRRFGVVSQECLLLNASLRDNVVFGRDFDTARLERALRTACAWEFVSQMPEGWDTHAGDRGVRLSGGQRQRIAIARAVYGDPEILVLDEATSSLDTESERAVQEAIDHAVAGNTALVIAHRLSTVLHADRVVVLNAGRVEAVGTHAQLLEQSPTYRRLYEMQFESPAADASEPDAVQ